MKIETLDNFREEIGKIDRALVDVIQTRGKGAVIEGIANAIIAHRHLEDARMRLGKVIQAIEGGVSILDHPEVKELIAQIRAKKGKD